MSHYCVVFSLKKKKKKNSQKPWCFNFFWTPTISHGCHTWQDLHISFNKCTRVWNVHTTHFFLLLFFIFRMIMNMKNNFTQNVNRNASFFYSKSGNGPRNRFSICKEKWCGGLHFFRSTLDRYSYTQTLCNFLFQVMGTGRENENNWLISTTLAVSCLFSLSKFARGRAGLLLLFCRPFRLRLLYRQKQNQCVRRFKDESIKKKIIIKKNTY